MSSSSSQTAMSEYTLSTKETACNNAEHCLTIYRPSFKRERIKLESYQLVWLASDLPMFNIENSDTSVKFENFRDFVDKIMIFNNVEHCQEYLQQSEKDGITTFLVCCDPHAEILIPELSDYKNIRSIYIVCQNQKEYLQWAANNPKTRQIYGALEPLVLDLSKNLEEFKKHEDSVTFTQIQSKAEPEEENTTDKQWSWWIKFIQILVHLPYPIDYCRQQFNLLKEYYVGNTAQINLIDEFQASYNPHDAIRWYSRDAFLYRLLNQALRKHNVELLFLFGYFVQDLYRQLTHEYEQFRLVHSSNSIIIVYRGQIMSRNEINELASYRVTVNNSFFSTTFDRHLATFFLNSLAEPDDEMQNVLFQIKLDCKLQSRPFANISHLSYFQAEDEILFTVGTLFEVGDVVYDETERLWLIEFKLLYDESIADKRDFQSELSSRRTLKNCVNKLSAFTLHGLHDVESQTTIFNKLTELFPQETKWLSAVKLKFQSEEQRLNGEEEFHSEIISNYEQAIQIWQDYQNDNELNCSIELGQLYKDIIEHYQDEIHDQNIPEKYYDLAVNHYLLALEKESSDYEKMKIYDQMSVVFQLRMKQMMIDDEDKYQNSSEKEQTVLMAAKYKELYIEYMLKFYPSNYIEIGRTHEYLAYLYRSIGKIEDASVNYEKALNIFLQHSYLPQTDVEHLTDEIVYFHMDDKHDYQTALQYQLIKHEYIIKMAEVSKSDNVYYQKHSMADSHIQLADIYSLLHQINLASKNLTAAMNLYNEIEDNMAERFHKEEKLTLISEKSNKLMDISSSDLQNGKRLKKDTD